MENRQQAARQEPRPVGAPAQVEFIWVKGHAGHELNERCDELATTAADGANLDIDTGFNESDL